jgi:hypothetical protein
MSPSNNMVVARRKVACAPQDLAEESTDEEWIFRPQISKTAEWNNCSDLAKKKEERFLLQLLSLQQEVAASNWWKQDRPAS